MQDDQRILWEGVSSLTKQELQVSYVAHAPYCTLARLYVICSTLKETFIGEALGSAVPYEMMRPTPKTESVMQRDLYVEIDSNSISREQLLDFLAPYHLFLREDKAAFVVDFPCRRHAESVACARPRSPSRDTSGSLANG